MPRRRRRRLSSTGPSSTTVSTSSTPRSARRLTHTLTRRDRTPLLQLYPVAFNYGKTTEQWIGNWLTARVKEGRIKRADVIIATKANCARIGGFPEGEERPDDYCYSFEADILEQSCRASLERLQCDYIDLYQLHWPTRDVPVFGW
eukprot:7390363-Prymnesium_polylepis.2